jgi:hypothetical protein
VALSASSPWGEHAAAIGDFERQVHVLLDE